MDLPCNPNCHIAGASMPLTLRLLVEWGCLSQHGDGRRASSVVIIAHGHTTHHSPQRGDEWMGCIITCNIHMKSASDEIRVGHALAKLTLSATAYY
jgi:hypothetical protein